MNDLSQPLKPSPMPAFEQSKFLRATNDRPEEVPAAEAERYLRDGTRVLELARRRVHELEALISSHQAEMARLRDIIARLEALRDGRP